jgi:hypothetical protein
MISDVAFQGNGCAISKASASMMTAYLKGKSMAEARVVFQEFHDMVRGDLDPETRETHLGKLVLFKGVRENRRGGERSFGSRTFAMWFVIVMVVFSFRAALRRRSVYSGTGRNDTWSGGGWGGGGGRGGGGGGTFSGGGGSFGGGGAGGRW